MNSFVTLALKKLKTGTTINFMRQSMFALWGFWQWKTGYELAIQQKVKYVNDILQALLVARKRVSENCYKFESI